MDPVCAVETTKRLGPNQAGLCECGCGMQAPIATRNRKSKGYVKGQPKRFVHGHSRKGLSRWSINPEGYRRVYMGQDRGYVFEHRLVWETAHGPVPRGHHIHHKNGNKLDNDLSNLELMTALEHKRVHSGCVRKDEQWHKPCTQCGTMKPLDKEHYYWNSAQIPMSICKPCHIANVCSVRAAKKHGIAQELEH